MPCSASPRRKFRILTLFGVATVLVILILCVCLINTNSIDLSPAALRGDPGKLIFVQAIFRHGDRNPAHGYPTDPYNDGKVYAGGWSALTKRGKQRMLSLGRFIRRRYSDLIPDFYFANDVYVLSSDADRCIMSAQSLLAGMFPPVDGQVIETELGWQPIPVHTSPRDLDKHCWCIFPLCNVSLQGRALNIVYTSLEGNITQSIPVHTIRRVLDKMVAAKRACSLYDKDLVDIYSSDEIRAVNAKHLSLYEKVSSHTGTNISTVAAAEGLYNTLDLQRSLNLTLPTWVDADTMAQLKELAILSLRLFTETPYMTRIRGGPLLAELRERMERRERTAKGPKLFLVSGHDLTLINVLRALGFTDQEWKPQFAATLLVELHTASDGLGPIVKLVYSNGHGNAPLQELQVPHCSVPCRLSTFLEVTKHNVPVDWEQECKQQPLPLL